MPLALQLVTRPVRVAGLVALAGALGLLSGALVLRAHPHAVVTAPVALVATALVLGVLAPLHGRSAAFGLWAARAGLAAGIVALVLPEGRPTFALRVVAALVVVAGLRLVGRGMRRAGDLPVWTSIAVGVGVAATLVAPALGGGIALGLAWLAVAAVIHATLVAPAATSAA